MKVEQSLRDAFKLREVLPEEDRVLVFWIEKLKDFQGNLNLLKRLNSPAIKVRVNHEIHPTIP